MPSFARRRPALTFYLIACGIASLVMVVAMTVFALHPASAAAFQALGPAILRSGGYANMISIAGFVPAAPLTALVFVFAAAPTIAAVVLARRGIGVAWPDFVGRLRFAGPGIRAGQALRVYLVMAVVYVLGLLVFDFVAGPGVQSFGRLESLVPSIVAGALLGLFIDEGGTLEELGWRGYLFPLLQARMRTPLVAALLVGVLHWAWHLPREVPNILGGFPLATWFTLQAWFLLLCAALSVLACYVVNKTGSVWPAIFVHGGTNVWSKAMEDAAAPSFGFADLRSVLVIMLAVVIIVTAGRRLGQRAPAAPSAGSGRRNTYTADAGA